MNDPIVDGRILKRGDMLYHTDRNWRSCRRGWVEFLNNDHDIGLVQVRCESGAVPVVKLSNLQWEAMAEQQELDEFYAELSAGNKLAKSALRHIRAQNSEIESLRSQLHSLQDAGEVMPVRVTGNLDEIDAQVWPFIYAEARKVGKQFGRIESYKYSLGNGGVVVLWDANNVHAMAVTIRDDMNRTRSIRFLAKQSVDHDIVPVPRELLTKLLSPFSEESETHVRARTILSSKSCFADAS